MKHEAFDEEEKGERGDGRGNFEPHLISDGRESISVLQAVACILMDEAATE